MRFLEIIDKKAEILSGIDTERIYVENIRSFFNLPGRVAKFLCDMAAKQHYFFKKIGIICLNEDCHRMILSVDKHNQIPEYVECDHCKELERAISIFHPTEKNLIEFYKLNKEKS